MLKITETDRTNRAVTLKLEGRIGGKPFEALRDECRRILAGGDRIVLDMGGVSFIERPAFSLFREMLKEDISLINCSLFLTEQLKNGGGHHDRDIFKNRQ
ncbi:MAG: hypothetical protein R2747_24245 [Pyrinomonadaceae bacterium]